ncbi:MAG: bifunctional 3-(3-hydroxy-phenyl)propionate/3-hydroxycinnamic acid hydroxylase [Burkholderiaceae bacterium]|nr:bifunctional 3-(3-hydroxy-phenyl)propionate/3-hydroxycinnamic acid hydroxylase [Burkholderiaceae bacterium]
MSEHFDCDVVIVGYGPTGAVLANLLGHAGVRTMVYEREADIYPLPRAAHYDGETMRVFQSLGLMQPIEAISRPGNQGMHFQNAEGQTLLVRTASDKPGPHGFANNWYFHQPDLERILRHGVDRYDCVEVRLQHEVVSVTQDERAAFVQVRDLVGDEGERSISTRYVIGCDGGRSLVRRTIGGASEDLGLHQPWLCLDLVLKRPVDLPEYTIQRCDPARPMTIVNMAGQRRRWEIMFMPGDDPETIAEPDKVWRLLAPWITPHDAEIERSAIYTFHSVIADTWRDRRLILAGDSAHQTPPFLGQGMCAGVRDASNLGWKLGAVLRDGAPDALLDTYASERRPHVHAFISLAVKVGGVIQTTDPEVAATRDRSFARSGPEIFSYPVPQLGPGAHAGGAEPVGNVFAQFRLDDGRLMDDAIGLRFALLANDAARAALAARSELASALARHDVVVLDAPGREALAWLAREGLAAVLLRPDRYVAGVAEGVSDITTLTRLLPKIEGR